MEALAARFLDALEAAEVTALEGLYAPDAVMWMNTTGRTRRARDILPFLPGMLRRMPDRRYADRRITPTAEGFIARYRLTGSRKDGARVCMDACIAAEVRDGVIVRVEEYADSAQMAALLG